MKSFSIIAVLAIFLFSSCGSYTETGSVAPFAHTKIFVDTIKADLDISNIPIEAQSGSTYLFGIRISGDNKYAEDGAGYYGGSLLGRRINRMKSAAIYKALKQSNGDIIVTPQYTTEVKHYLFVSRYKVTVKGYKANIKGLYQEPKKAKNYLLNKSANNNFTNNYNAPAPERSDYDRPRSNAAPRRSNDDRQYRQEEPATYEKEYKASILYRNGGTVDATIIGDMNGETIKLRLRDGQIVESRMSDIKKINIK